MSTVLQKAVNALPEGAQALEVKATDLSRRLDGLKIENVRDVAPAVLTRTLEESVIIRNLADDFLREVETTVGPTVDAAFKAHRAATAMRDGLKKPAEALKREAGELGWACDSELKRRQSEAWRIAAEERDRLQREADERAERERLAALKAAEDARIEEASKLEARGDHQGAAKLIEAPVVVETPRSAPVFVPPPPQIAPAKVDGASFGETWGDYEVTDPRMIPRDYWMIDEKKLTAVIRSTGGKITIPGIRILPPKPVTRRTGRA